TEARELCRAEAFGLDAQPEVFALGESVLHCSQVTPLANHNLRAFDFLSGLFGVAAIGEEQALAFADENGAGASVEAAEIADVGKMGDEQGIQAVFFEQGTQPGLAGGVVHERSVARDDNWPGDGLAARSFESGSSSCDTNGSGPTGFFESFLGPVLR